MKPIEVGFDGSLIMHGGGDTKSWKLARSLDEDKGPDTWSTSPNININGTITNTFIWWGKTDPELFYRSKDGILYRVNFEEL